MAGESHDPLARHILFSRGPTWHWHPCAVQIVGVRTSKHRELLPSNMGSNVSFMLVPHVAGRFHPQAPHPWPICPPLSVIAQVLSALTEGMGINAVTRLYGVSNNSIYRWHERLSGVKKRSSCSPWHISFGHSSWRRPPAALGSSPLLAAADYGAQVVFLRMLGWWQT